MLAAAAVLVALWIAFSGVALADTADLSESGGADPSGTSGVDPSGSDGANPSGTSGADPGESDQACASGSLFSDLLCRANNFTDWGSL
jgi:hypothetical protein